jgi:cell wall-associated NlpC family hydrolase
VNDVSCSNLLRRGGTGVAIAVSALALTGLPAVASSTSSTPVTTCARITQGSTGPAVKTIQQALGIAADGDFGPQTAATVKTWRHAHGLRRGVGAVNAAMWAALPASVSQTACGQAVTGSGVRLSCAALSRGDQGVAVAVLQRALGIKTPSGRFGWGTAKVLKAAQTAAKLPATGTTTQQTWQSLKLLGTPVCEPKQSADAKAQAKIRAQVAALVAELQDSPGTTTDKVARAAKRWGKTQIGKPYIFGGTGPKGYDCSGLVMRAMQHAGITIPRVAADQYAAGGTKVSLADAQAGDLLFFASDVSQPSTVYHVVMYLGHGKVLSAPFTGTDVQIQPLFTTNLLPLVVRPTAGLTLPLKPGATGWSVTQLQLALNRHGNDLAADGGFGPATKTAVQAWQAKKDLPATGVVDLDTWLTLG